VLTMVHTQPVVFGTRVNVHLLLLGQPVTLVSYTGLHRIRVRVRWRVGFSFSCILSNVSLIYTNLPNISKYTGIQCKSVLVQTYQTLVLSACALETLSTTALVR
jgi:hypothetical protein